ncbi:3-oxoacyl-[acyl-carrier-protein] synthase III C-terminal domain-containing protein [Paraburkholderia sartisoli]|nr:3-oxoacyl-[acyl-carrier-protein] synthase III C-terminal domain-containing protein [Paraburkholderia sartisoli]
MDTPVITALATWVPDPVPLSQWREMERRLRLIEHRGWNAWMKSWQPDYGQYVETHRDTQNDGCVPSEHGLSAPDMVPVETGTDLSGLAAKVANTLCAERAPGAPPVDIVMFCHSSLDEHVSTTTAGRLCAEAGTSCFPFSVSQQHGASVFTALRLAADLFIAEPDVHTILIVAAEKWCPPFSRLAGADLVHGDAAGALLVERSRHATAGLQLLDVAARHVIPGAGRPATGVCDGSAPPLISMIELLLARHGLRRDDIDEVVGHRGIPSLTGAVCDLLKRPATGAYRHCVHLGAAESIVRLAHLLANTALHQPHRILLWGFGFGGHVGAALFEACGAPSLHLLENVRSTS